MNPSAEVVMNDISVSVSNEQPETTQHAEDTKKDNPVPVSRSRSKSVSRTRSNSPSLRTFSRSRSPVRHNRSISPRRRSRLPLRDNHRSISPMRSRDRSRSPKRINVRSRSPVRSNYRSRSPVRTKYRSISPIRSKYRSRSPMRTKYRSISPIRSKYRSRSPMRSKYRSRSPVRFKHQSRSEVIGRSISPARKNKTTNQRNQRLKSGFSNEPKFNFGTLKNDKKYDGITTIGTMKCHKSSRDWLPSHLFPIFASMLDAYGHDEHLSDIVSNMEHMFRGVNTKKDAVYRMGKEEVLRILAMYIMTNGKFRNSYNKFKMYKRHYDPN